MGNKYLASRLDYSNQDLSEIPDEVFQFKNLRKLYLAGNAITSLPQRIANLDQLELLDLSNNKITDLRAKVFNLKKLKTLIINNNRIKKLPKQIGNLNRLEKLICAGNLLETLPDEISLLEKLRILNVSNNPIREFPQAILTLSNLDTLYLNKSRLEKLPISEMDQKLLKLKRLYCFNPSIEANRNYRSLFEILQKEKGNAFETFKLAASMIENNDITNLERDGSRSQTNIFISYSHKDAEYKNEIVTHLEGIKYTGFSFSYWVDSHIESGDKFRTTIEAALEKANIAIIIVSPSFMASNFIQTVELPKLLDSAERKGTRFLILIARRCHFEDTALGKYQTVLPNTPSSPLNGMSPPQQDLVYYNLVQDVKKNIQND